MTAEPTPLLKRAIPKTKEEMPVIGLGTWLTFSVGKGPAERAPLEEIVKAFVDGGGRMIDTSPMYNQSEEVVGDITEKLHLRRKLFFATKVWTTGEEEGVVQMKESMWKLRSMPLDLMQIHNLVNEDTHLDTLADWKAQGRVRYIGVTHYQAGAHGALAEVLRARPVDFLQVNYSVAERDAEEKLLPLARDLGVAVIINRPFGGGEVLARLKDRPLPAWAAEIDCTTWSQVLLKFIISHPAVTCVIPATSKIAHLRDNLAAGTGRLPDEKLRARIAAEAL